MRFVPQNEFFNSYKLPVSRVQWAARGAQQGAATVGAPPALVQAIDELGKFCAEYAVSRSAWRAANSAKASPELMASDYAVDRSFSNFAARVKMEADDFAADTPRGKAARAMLAGPLNVEVFSVTNATREEEESMLAVIVGEIEADYLSQVSTCGLDAHFDKLKADYDAFVTEMHRNPNAAPAPTTAQLQAQAEHIRSKMIEVIHRANGAWPTPSEQDGLNRAHVLGPFAIQNDRAAAYYKRNRGTTLSEVDPETGEEVLEDGADPATPTPPVEPVDADAGVVEPV
ncbi:hypothetical protein [Bradymonas sediminis]|uniref:Uncharacterized protein n=1 Tax=Bradymonas sediminis TaxID=1548548 RepID=A0A2Z4FHV1_9DELT|nr:hypothetical protein [Bradymonas sediminis]AWV88567.1 hypothetical protein DN745_04135 [Bradymonas sediminis]TDP77709.1 hypothetical protein DFR33_101620 [Bradymonas sediminis]